METESPRRLSRHAPSKVNLGLHVLRRRNDGYHDIETVFLRIGWSDVVSVEPAASLSVTCSDSSLPVDSRNTCLAAAELLADRFVVGRGARIHLDKRVPYGAGLGSGSSDAAATLRLLDELWELRTPDEELMQLGASVGSDVPFFLNGPLAHARGRGEILSPLECPNRALSVVVAVPAVHISSAEAYRLVEPRTAGRESLIELLCSGDFDDWRRSLRNDFEEPIRQRHPEISDLRTALEDAGARYVSLSGSGSAVYGLFSDPDQARSAEASCHLPGLRSWAGEVLL